MQLDEEVKRFAAVRMKGFKKMTKKVNKQKHEKHSEKTGTRERPDRDTRVEKTFT